MTPLRFWTVIYKKISHLGTFILKSVGNPDQINTQFPDQFSIGNSNYEPAKLEIDFDDLIVQGLYESYGTLAEEAGSSK